MKNAEWRMANEGNEATRQQGSRSPTPTRWPITCCAGKTRAARPAPRAAEQREWVDFKNLELYGPLGRPTPGVPTVAVLVSPTPVAPGLIRRTRDLVLRPERGGAGPPLVPGMSVPQSKGAFRFRALCCWIEGQIATCPLTTSG